MGRPKAWLRCGREYLLQYVVRLVSEVVDPVVVASRPGQDLPPLPNGVYSVADAIQDTGPLAGIAAGFGALVERSEAAFVVACDQPLLRPQFIARLIELLEDYEAVVPMRGGRLHPLTALYRLETRRIVTDMLQTGVLRVTTFAERCAARIVCERDFADCDPRLESLCNFNDPQGFAALVEKLDAERADG
jgi:molybdopterin-guanine dinucleotide biosynthesis protein A